MDKILTIIPIYNKEEFLEGAIESILQQTHTNVELVLVDDHSTDKSLEIAKRYEHLDNVTLLQNIKNKGCYYTRNKALEHFKNKQWDYFTVHDADDISDINRFKTILSYFQDHNLLGLKSTYIRVNKNFEPQLTPKGSTIDIYASEGIAIFPRKTFEILGYYDDTRFSGDTDYWWRLERYCTLNPPYNVGISPEQLYLAVNHEDNLTRLYDFETTRPQYWQKCIQEINGVMSSKNNFYRDIFE